MLNKFCSVILIFTGVHPHHPLGKLRITLNVTVMLLSFLFGVVNIYKEKQAETVESLSIFAMILVLYVTNIFGRKVIQEVLKDAEQFWKVNVEDEQINFVLRYFWYVDRFHRFLMFAGTFAFSSQPLLLHRTSIFNLYRPRGIPVKAFFLFEFYSVSFVAITFICSNIFMSSLLTRAVIQFRLLNLKISAISFSKVENDRDLEKCVKDLKDIILYHQFLIRYVENLNKLLSAPVAFEVILRIGVMCLEMYASKAKGSNLMVHVKLFLVSLSMVGGFFLVHSLPAQLLIDESTAAAEMIYYELEWYLPKVQPLRKDLLTIIMRSQKGVCIKAGNYHIVHNETILKMLKVAYTFYTFLQTLS